MTRRTRYGLGLGLGMAILVAGLGASSAEARGGSPIVRALVFLASHVEQGFEALGDRLDRVEEFQTLGLANQDVLRGEIIEVSEGLVDLRNLIEEGLPHLQRPDLVLTTDFGRRGNLNCRFKGTSHNLVFEVENVGLTQAAPSTFSVVAFPDGPLYRFEAGIPALAPGTVLEILVPDPPFCDDVACDDFIAWADARSVVAETEEANNLVETLFAPDGDPGSTCPLPTF